ncbi:MAG: HDIG domain-containing protein [Caloramator sp.]|nr:HDIG domain-containing protein [Caloramator sp.]
MINTMGIKIGDKMKSNKRLLIGVPFKNTKFLKAIIFLITFLVLFIISSIGVIPKKYSLKEGDIAPSDIKAPRDFVDEVATQEKIDKAVSSVTDKYSKNINIKNNAIEKVKIFFEKVIEYKSIEDKEEEKIIKLKSISEFNLEDNDYKVIIQLKDEEIKNISSFLQNCLTKILSQDIMANNENDIKRAKEDFNFYIENSSMSVKLKRICNEIGLPLIKPNLYFDAHQTNELKEEAKRQVQPVIYKKNQNIILKGEVVTSKHIYLMRKAGLLLENKLTDIWLYFGVALTIILIEIIIGFYLYKYRKNIFNENNKLAIIAIILCINAIFTIGINTISGYLIPVALNAILITLIFDPLTAFFITIPTAIIVAFITNFSIDPLLLYIIGSISGILFISNVHERNNILLSGIYTGLINGIVALSGNLINNNLEIAQILIQCFASIGGGILSAMLALGVLPVFEQLFDIITPIKLLELSNPNQPLLKRLLFEAPGTYHHSILVGNLSEAAADEIGANSLLARAGAYYHDIGKIKRPYFFKENQITNDNPHDKITPKLSALIITSHVKDGLELAQKYRLPDAVKVLIQQHHGTTLVKYFYVMASNNSSENVTEESFRYEGPKPKSKEAAIIMLADSVEAAVRSLNNPTILEVENMVTKVIDDKIDDGQLDEAELTLKDIETIKKSFIKVLIGIFHNRIEYPDLNDKAKEGEGTVDRI